MRRFSLLSLSLASLLLATTFGCSQTNELPPANQGIIPVPRTDEKGTNRFLELNERVKEAAGQAQLIFVGDSITQGWEGNGKQVHFLDIGHLFIGADGKIPKEMMRDFLHPSALGYQLWAEAMEPRLAELLGDKPGKP